MAKRKKKETPYVKMTREEINEYLRGNYSVF